MWYQNHVWEGPGPTDQKFELYPTDSPFISLFPLFGIWSALLTAASPSASGSRPRRHRWECWRLVLWLERLFLRVCGKCSFFVTGLVFHIGFLTFFKFVKYASSICLPARYWELGPGHVSRGCSCSDSHQPKRHLRPQVGWWSSEDPAATAPAEWCWRASFPCCGAVGHQQSQDRWPGAYE